MSARPPPIWSFRQGEDYAKVVIFLGNVIFLCQLSSCSTVFLTLYEAKSLFFLMLFIHFLQEKFASSDILCIFAVSVPTKPLNDVQMCGAFY
jgi:hypothetical protein